MIKLKMESHGETSFQEVLNCFRALPTINLVAHKNECDRTFLSGNLFRERERERKGARRQQMKAKIKCLFWTIARTIELCIEMS